MAQTPHFALHRLPLSAADDEHALFPVKAPWLGVLLPKRWAKRAVTRNAIRRQIYESARPLTNSLPQAAHVVRLRSGFDRERFVSASSMALKRAARDELDQLWARAANRGLINGVGHVA